MDVENLETPTVERYIPGYRIGRRIYYKYMIVLQRHSSWRSKRTCYFLIMTLRRLSRCGNVTYKVVKLVEMVEQMKL